MRGIVVSRPRPSEGCASWLVEELVVAISKERSWTTILSVRVLVAVNVDVVRYNYNPLPPPPPSPLYASPPSILTTGSGLLLNTIFLLTTVTISYLVPSPSSSPVASTSGSVFGLFCLCSSDVLEPVVVVEDL